MVTASRVNHSQQHRRRGGEEEENEEAGAEYFILKAPTEELARMGVEMQPRALENLTPAAAAIPVEEQEVVVVASPQTAAAAKERRKLSNNEVPVHDEQGAEKMMMHTTTTDMHVSFPASTSATTDAAAGGVVGRTPPTTTTTTEQQQKPAVDGLSFPILPPCVFDPVIQDDWETRIVGLRLNDAVHNGEEEIEEEEEEEEAGTTMHLGGDGCPSTSDMNAIFSEMDIDLARVVGAGGVVDHAMEGGGEEEEEEGMADAALAETMAARAAAVVANWQTDAPSAPAAESIDPEDMVDALAAVPLLRYSNPVQQLFPTRTTTATTTAAHVSQAAGEEGEPGPSAAAAPVEGADASPEEINLLADTTTTTMSNDDDDNAAMIVPLPVTAAVRVPLWERDVLLQGGTAAASRLGSLPLTLDLNDPGMVFQDVARKAERDREFKSLIAKSTATILPYQKRATITARGVESTDEAIIELTKLNISRDNDYYAQPKRKTGSGGIRAVHHAKAASQLQTCPLTLSEYEQVYWHRPRGNWWPVGPPKPSRRHQGHGQLLFSTLVGNKKWVGVNLSTTTLEQAWKYNFKSEELPLFVTPGYPPRIIPQYVPLAETGLPSAGRNNSGVAVIAAFRGVSLKRTRIMESIEDESNPALLRPPLAFCEEKEMRASTRGRIVLIEYLQEAPLMLNRPGMGVRLATYYRRTAPGDIGHQAIRNEAVEAGQRWRVGAINPIGEDDESPFLGELSPGSSQLSVETGLFTAPAAPHVPLESDFLLTRAKTGLMNVREIAGTVTSGQQLPLHRVPVPGSRDLKDLEERRIFVHVFRDLRDKQRRNFPVEEQVVSLEDLNFLFPSRPITALRLFLKDGCGLVLYKRVQNREWYCVREGTRMPSEAELRKKVNL